MTYSVRREWDSRLEAELTRRWISGEAAESICTSLRVSRDALFGRVKKLRLPKRRVPKARNNWTPEGDAELTRRWLAGELVPSICAAMKLTQASMFGRVRTLKLKPRRVSKKARALVDAQATQSRHLNREDARPLNLSRWADPGSMYGHGCKFPLWQHHEQPTHEYCDEKRVDGRPYCRSHLAIAYLPAPPPEVKERQDKRLFIAERVNR